MRKEIISGGLGGHTMTRRGGQELLLPVQFRDAQNRRVPLIYETAMLRHDRRADERIGSPGKGPILAGL